ncbi:MAG: Hint domain-containing protein [Roseovarius sp.]
MKPTFVRQDTCYSTKAKPAAGHRSDVGLPGAALIMTLKGEVPVADLRPGARVVTRDTGTAILKQVRRRRITGRAVSIKASSLGHNRPERDALLPAGQQVLVRDWRAKALFGAPQVLVPAERLVDGEFVTLSTGLSMEVHDLIFDSPHVLYVDGLEVASSLEALRVF